MNRNSFLVRGLLFYGLKFPNHRGKWFLTHRFKALARLDFAQECEEQRQGLKWVLNPSDYAHQGIFWLGEWDRWEIHHLLRLLKPDSVMLDIGANIGYYSLVLAKRIGSSFTIHSFEPNPPTYERLRRHVEMNGLKNIHLHAIGLSDKDGTARLRIRDDNSGAAILEDGDGIPTTTLDAFVEREQIQRLDLIKIDIEGSEYRMLQGARTALERLKPTIQIELDPAQLRKNGANAGDVVKLLAEYNYVLFQIERERLVKLKELPDEKHYINVLCFHRDRVPAGLS